MWAPPSWSNKGWLYDHLLKLALPLQDRALRGPAQHTISVQAQRLNSGCRMVNDAGRLPGQCLAGFLIHHQLELDLFAQYLEPLTGTVQRSGRRRSAEKHPRVVNLEMVHGFPGLTGSRSPGLPSRGDTTPDPMRRGLLVRSSWRSPRSCRVGASSQSDPRVRALHESFRWSDPAALDQEYVRRWLVEQG